MRKLRRRFETVPLAEVHDKVARQKREKTAVKVVRKEDPYSAHGVVEKAGSASSSKFLSRQT